MVAVSILETQEFKFYEHEMPNPATRSMETRTKEDLKVKEEILDKKAWHFWLLFERQSQREEQPSWCKCGFGREIGVKAKNRKAHIYLVLLTSTRRRWL